MENTGKEPLDFDTVRDFLIERAIVALSCIFDLLHRFGEVRPVERENLQTLYTRLRQVLRLLISFDPMPISEETDVEEEDSDTEYEESDDDGDYGQEMYY